MARNGKSREQKVYVLNEDAPFAVQEAYKALRTNIIYALKEKESICIGITGALPGDAKSTTAMNIAISFAQLGKKVILVDCDLRLPTLASKLGITGIPGLSDLVTGQCKFSEAAKRVEEFNIDVLPAGNIPNDPTYLIQSKPMMTVIESLKKYYEVVVFDLPSVNLVTDAAILGTAMDGFCLTVRHGRSDLREIREMVEQLKLAGANLLGFVYTGAPKSKSKDYSFYEKQVKKNREEQ